MELVSAVDSVGAGPGGPQPAVAGDRPGDILPYGIARWWEEHRGRSPFFLVPSREDAVELTLALVTRDGPLLGAAVVGTFDDLASLLLGGRVQRLGEVAREAAVRMVAAPTLSAPDSVLGRLGSSPAGLAGLLEEMEASGLGAGQISRVLAAWGARASESDVRRLAEELRVIYGSYAALCAARSWRGTASTLRGAALRVKGTAETGGSVRDAGSGPAVSPLHDLGQAAWTRPILCVGFLTFTPVQRLLLDTLSRGATVTLEPSWPGSPVASRAPLRLLLSAGRRGEMETVAAEVMDLMRAGMDAADIGLVARSVGHWRRAAQQVFSAYGIPLRVDASFRFRETGLGNALLSAVGALLEGESRALIGWIRSRYAQAEPLALGGRELERWRGIVSWPADPATRGALAELFPQDMALLQACVEPGTGGASRLRPAGVVGLARSMVAVSARRLPLTHPTVAEDARALQALETSLAEVGTMDSAGMGPAGEGEDGAWAGAAPLLDMLADAALWPAPRGAGVVTLTSATRLRLRPYRAIFVLGLVDQEFPAGDQSPGLLPASLRRECNRLGVGALFEEPAEDLDAKLFELAVSRATECVYLSQRVSDDRGNALSPSPFLLSTAAAEGLPRWRQRTLADVVHPVHLAPSHHEYLRSCAAESLQPAGREDASRLAAAAGGTRPAAHLADARVMSALASRPTFSAGEIETYARCPLAWFLQSQVGVRAEEEGAGSRDLGLLVHAVMARLYAELRRRELLPLSPASCAAALACAEHVLGQVAAGEPAAASPAALALLLAQARYRVREHLEREAAAGGAMVTEAVELALPTRGVDLGDGLVVHGRVDRVDVSPPGDGFAVTDYKTGSYVPRKAWAEEGLLQVALYLLALSALWPGRHALGGGYLFMGRGQGKGLLSEAAVPLAGEGAPWTVVPEEELRGQLEDCRQAALGAVRGMRAGRLRPDPTRSCPRYCSLGPVCRSRRGSRWGWS